MTSIRIFNGTSFGPSRSSRVCIEDTQLTLYILDAKAPERAKLDIFERVNSGAPLTRQQMRNCLYNGRATVWLKEVASTPVFIEATGESLDAKRMRDREAINRFCAFSIIGWLRLGRSFRLFRFTRALRKNCTFCLACYKNCRTKHGMERYRLSGSNSTTSFL